MKISVRPAKRDGEAKVIFDQPLERKDISISSDEITLTFVARDIYSSASNQRYTIQLSVDELATILDLDDAADEEADGAEDGANAAE
jgi:hypothetical protein